VMKRDHADTAVRVAIGQAWTTKRGQIAIAELPSATVAANGSSATAPVERVDIEMPTEPAHEITSNGSHNDSNGSSAKHGKKRVLTYEEDVHKALLKAPIQPALDIGVMDPREAITKHMQIAGSGRGDDAARAMYSVAYLQKRELKDNAAALRTLGIYMQRFIKKSRAEHADALWLRVYILCERKFDDACRRAARIYSEAAPSTQKSGIADRIIVAP
jgi:hypothetical protein